MKRKLLTLAIAGLFAVGAYAQSYYYAIKTTGTTSEYAMNTTGAATLISASTGSPVTSTLSAAQVLPFSWSFYGKTVNNYKVSSSGYLTFDVSQTSDMTNNVALPSTTAPKNAIFAFWDNTRLEPIVQGTTTFASDIRSWTYGSSPSRVFVIQWRLVLNAGTGSSNVTYYAIRLYEGGNFDIVENYGFGAFTATVGCQDSTQTDGTMISGSPNMTFGGANGSYDQTKSDVYTFYKGPQKQVKVALSNGTDGLVSLNTAGGLPIKVKAFNMGATDIASATINYTIGSGATITGNVSGLSITNSGGLGVVASPTAFTPVSGDAGNSKTAKAWLSNINGLGVYSDTVSFSFFVNEGISGTKKVMFEEGSGAWCGYCPDGHRVVRDLEANPTYDGKFTAVIHHNSDGLAQTESNTLNSTYATGYPTAWVDRYKFSDQPSVSMSRNVWESKIAAKMNDVTPVNISIVNKNFNASTGALTYGIKVDFVDHGMPGDIRIHTFIVEDECRGPYTGTTSTTWTQHNYYSIDDAQAGGASHPLYNEPAYMVGYYHNHVVRAIPSMAWGTAGVITAPTKGATYTQNYSYTLPAATTVDYTTMPAELRKISYLQSTANGLGINKATYSYILAFVSYHDANDVTKRFIINATDDKSDPNGLFNTGVVETKNNVSISNVFPNPSNGITVVDFNLNNTDKNVVVEVVDILGKSVMTVKEGAYAAGSHSVSFDATEMNAGVYFVNVKTSEGISTLKFVVSH